MTSNSEDKVLYRPVCSGIWKWMEKHEILSALPIIGGVLFARCLPTGLVERILFSKRNEATRCIAEGFGNHVWEPKEARQQRPGS